MTSPAHTQMMTARTPEDLLAAVPIVLGFQPEESVAMLTFGGAEAFHARIDLPLDDAERKDCAGSLLRPSLRHRVAAAAFVLYTGDAALASACARTIGPVFEDAGVEVLGVLRSDGRRWFAVPLDGSTGEGAGTPYDLTAHTFTATAVAAGRVVRASRAELAATVAADRRAVRAVDRARARLAIRPLDEPAEHRWLVETLETLDAHAARADPATAARLLVALGEAAGRDALLGRLDRRGAERLLQVLSALVRAAPSDLLAPAASVLAFAAWLAGDGALAWCALDRAEQGDPSCALADLVARALETAMPPTVWERR